MGNKKSTYHPKGPVRHASESGVFIQLLEFPGIYGHRDSLLKSKKYTYTPALKCVLGGYTFAVRCFFDFDKDGHVTVDVAFYLQAGEWDNDVEWPFDKKIWVNITHPKDHNRDMWLLVKLDQARMTKKPDPGNWNYGKRSARVTFQQLEYNGFIQNNKLYVNVELH